MIAQDKKKLENQFLIDEAHSLYKARFITELEFDEIQKSLPTPKKQRNILLRIGFTFLGMLLYASISGFISLLGIRIIDDSFSFFIFVYAAIGFIGAEFFVRQNHIEPGLDDSFLIIGQLVLAGGIGTITYGNELPVAVVATIVSLLTYLRYLNRASILIFCISSTATIAFGLFELGALGKAILPFVLMVYGLAIYFTCKKITKNFQFPFYHKGILLVKYFGLILFYVAGNYLVVRELSVVLLGNDIAPNSDIPFAWFFYIFTFVVPIIYMFYGIKLLDRAMLWIGFITIGFSFYTIDYYFLEVPIQVYLTLGGLLLFAVAYFSIKALKDKTQGITFQPDRFINSNDFLHTEALILTSQFGLKPEIAVESPMEFGGGGFSGGGSSGAF